MYCNLKAARRRISHFGPFWPNVYSYEQKLTERAIRVISPRLDRQHTPTVSQKLYPSIALFLRYRNIYEDIGNKRDRVVPYEFRPCRMLSYASFGNNKRNKSSHRPHTSAKEYGLRIRTLDPDYFQNLTVTCVALKFVDDDDDDDDDDDFLVQRHICDKIFMKIRSLSPEI